jgi:uncharacterized protein YjbJ (UPF0337 family)
MYPACIGDCWLFCNLDQSNFLPSGRSIPRYFHNSVFRLSDRNYSGTYVFSFGNFMKSTEAHVDWNRVEGNWKQIKGSVKEKWGKLTDDDLEVINGRRDQLEGKIQQHYGLAKDQVRKDVDDWYSSHKWS